MSDENESDHLEGSWSEDPEALIIDQESTRTLEREITKVLSPMENKVLDYYLRGYGYVKIAEIMGKTPKSIDNALQRIREKYAIFCTCTKVMFCYAQKHFSLSFWIKVVIL